MWQSEGNVVQIKYIQIIRISCYSQNKLRKRNGDVRFFSYIKHSSSQMYTLFGVFMMLSMPLFVLHNMEKNSPSIADVTAPYSGPAFMPQFVYLFIIFENVKEMSEFDKNKWTVTLPLIWTGTVEITQDYWAAKWRNRFPLIMYCFVLVTGVAPGSPVLREGKYFKVLSCASQLGGSAREMEYKFGRKKRKKKKRKVQVDTLESKNLLFVTYKMENRRTLREVFYC